VDAAVATALATTVVLPASCGIGGDLFAIVAEQGKPGKPTSFIGSGIASRTVGVDYMREHGEVREDGSRIMQRYGPLAPAVPGLIDAVYSLLDRFGTKSFGELASDAINYAEGFPISALLALHIANRAEVLSRYEPSAAIYLPGGKPPAPGEVFRQTNLAKSLRQIAEGGPDVFYRGDIAKRIGDYLASVGGVLTADDFADQETYVGDPISTTYRGHTVWETGLPTQGMILLEALNIIEGTSGIQPDSAAGVHLLAEAMKLAFADRLAYAGDPKFVPDQTEPLISKAFAANRREAIDLDKASTTVPAGKLKPGDTTYLCTMDGDGMMVSLILSVSAAFGSCVVGGDTGIVLNNRAGDCFSLDDASPNVYAPGKKTMHTLNCYLISDTDGTPVLVGGTPGGDSQPQWNLQVISGLIDAGLDVQAAVEMPRWTVYPGTYPADHPNPYDLRIENRFGPEILGELAAKGHTIVEGGSWTQGGSHHLIVRDPESGAIAGGADPRSEGVVIGF
jgi:gamma-glutamyltranspeptidase/glutathione hydrolase